MITARIYLLIILAFSALVNAQANALPPRDGKFFYADLRQGKVYGMHYIDVLLGTNHQHFQLALNSEQYTLGVISTECPNHICYVSDKYDSSLSTSSVPDNNLFYHHSYIFNHQTLADSLFTTKGFKD
jgi:hypothetical protein